MKLRSHPANRRDPHVIVFKLRTRRRPEGRDGRWLGTETLFDLPPETGGAARQASRRRARRASCPTPRGRQSLSQSEKWWATGPLRGDRAGKRTGPQPEVDTSRAGCLRVRTFSGDPEPEGPTSRPCSAGESVTSRRVATYATSYPSMGFHFPFEVSDAPRIWYSIPGQKRPRASLATGSTRERAQPHRVLIQIHPSLGWVRSDESHSTSRRVCPVIRSVGRRPGA